jgi:hypothetical protein
MHALLFLLGVFGGMLLSLFYSPIFAFVAYQVVYFFNPAQRWWRDMIPSLPYSMITVVVMLIALLLNYSKIPTNKILDVAPLKWQFALLATFILASSFALVPDRHSTFLIEFIKLVITCILAFKLITDEKKLNIVLYAYMFGCWYIGLVAFQMGRNSGVRLEGIGPIDSLDSNGTAAVLAPCLVVCLHYFYFAKTKLVKVLVSISGALTANGLVLINSRGAFLAATVSIAYYIIMLYRNPLKLIAKKSQIGSAINLTRYRKTKVILLICVGLIAVVNVADDAFIERIQTIAVSGDSEQESGSTRMHFWEGAWNMAKDYPLGVGIGGFEYMAPAYIPEDIHTGGSRNRAVHSSYFEILSEVGYLGLASFLLMLYGCFKLSKATRAMLKQKLMENQYFQVVALEGMLISFLVSGIFLNRSRAVVLYWFITFICAAYCIYVVRKDELKIHTE